MNHLGAQLLLPKRYHPSASAKTDSLCDSHDSATKTPRSRLRRKNVAPVWERKKQARILNGCLLPFSQSAPAPAEQQGANKSGTGEGELASEGLLPDSEAFDKVVDMDAPKSGHERSPHTAGTIFNLRLSPREDWRGLAVIM